MEVDETYFIYVYFFPCVYCYFCNYDFYFGAQGSRHHIIEYGGDIGQYLVSGGFDNCRFHDHECGGWGMQVSVPETSLNARARD